MTIEIDDIHFRAASRRALELGTSTEFYIQSLIDADDESLDAALAPVRENFSQAGTFEVELDDAVDEARRAIIGGWRPEGDRRLRSRATPRSFHR